MSNVFKEPLTPVSPVARIACGVIVARFSALFPLTAIWLTADMLTTRSLAAPGISLWGLAAVLAAIGLPASFVAWRLLRGGKATNGVTTLPLAFLQAFGWLAFIFSIVLAVKGERSIMLAGSVAFAFLLIFIARRVASRRRGDAAATTRQESSSS